MEREQGGDVDIKADVDAVIAENVEVDVDADVAGEGGGGGQDEQRGGHRGGRPQATDGGDQNRHLYLHIAIFITITIIFISQ